MTYLDLCLSLQHMVDVVLIADTPQDLNNMLDMTHSYASHWHYSINPTKSAVVTYSNVTRPRIQTAWRFGTDSIPEKESHPHLGIQRSSSRISSRCNNIMQSGSKTLFSLTGSGAKRRGLSPPILTTLWETYCIPRMLYGTEIINLYEGEKATLDKYQNQVFKTLLGLPRTTSSAAVNLLTGLTPVSTSIDLLHLRLLGKILTLPHTRLESRLFYHALCQHPQSNTLKKYKDILQKYNLPELTTCSRLQHPYQTWKRKFSDAAKETVMRSTWQEVQEKSTLHLFSGISPAQLDDIFPTVIEPANLREAVILKAQLLTSTYLTKTRLSKIQRNVVDTLCPACKTEEETTTHMISDCVVYDPERQALLLRFPANETSELGKLSKAQQSTAVTRLILLGITLQGKTEAVDFHKITLQYILGIHHARSQFL